MTTKLDLVSIENATSLACARRYDVMKSADRIQMDETGNNRTARADRLAGFECVVCWYIHSPRQHTNKSTKAPCRICEKTIRHGNGDIPLICDECAKEHRLCRQCGATIDLRGRRKFEPKARPTNVPR